MMTAGRSGASSGQVMKSDSVRHRRSPLFVTRGSMRVRPTPSCRVPAFIASRSIAGPGATVGIVIFHQFLMTISGCACYLVGDEEAGDRGRRRPAVCNRAAAGGGRTPRRADRAHGRDAHSRRPRVRTRPAGARARDPGQHSRRAGVDYPHVPFADGDEIEVGAVTLASSTRPATGRSTAASPSSTTRAATSRGSC